jgi:hypothetical protein
MNGVVNRTLRRCYRFFSRRARAAQRAMPNRQLTLARKNCGVRGICGTASQRSSASDRMMRFRGAIHGLLIWFIDTSLDRRAGAQQGRAQ